jgi:hypothetical protein
VLPLPLVVGLLVSSAFSLSRPFPRHNHRARGCCVPGRRVPSVSHPPLTACRREES